MLNVDFFKKVEEIESLFNQIEYNYNKKQENRENISLIFKKRDNIEAVYLVVINNDMDIDVTIPIKNSNYKYNTKFSNIDNVYSYLHLHSVNYGK